ncbi:hypothetical protein PUN28_015669 [Cardiocondyla obscurior]|uniref:Uncharacterized protein n=1 Tax=Cardiocondyla obscurior TaxID=286306 RepID=A0AAW2F0A6_9HYME
MRYKWRQDRPNEKRRVSPVDSTEFTIENELPSRQPWIVVASYRDKYLTF